MGARELFVYIEDKPRAVVIHDGFESGATVSSPLHSHRYAEVHLTSRAEAEIYTSDGEYRSREGTVTVIPAGRSHSLRVEGSDTVHRAFLIDYPVQRIMQAQISKPLLAEIERVATAHGDGELYSMLTLICQRVLRTGCAMRHVEDRELLIHEFFANRYHGRISLADLAAELNLCTKQTARLVERYMGASFSKALMHYRVSAAKALIKSNPTLTLSAIAQAVGYDSYSGFWKAFKEIERDQTASTVTLFQASKA